MEKYAGKSGSLQMVANDDEGSDDGRQILGGSRGVVVVLSEATCRELLEHVNNAIAKDIEDRTNPNFGNVYSRKNRFDYKLDLKQATVSSCQGGEIAT